MRERTRHLGELALQLRRRTTKLMPLVRSIGSPADHEVDRRVAYVTIELLNAWSSFTRSFYISSALRAYTTGGARINVTKPGIVTSEDAVTLATRTLKNKKATTPVPRHMEPSWYPARNVITLVNELGASNIATVSAALSYPTQVLNCLPTARNFFAHRNGDTAARCRQLCMTLSIPQMWRPADVLLHRDYTKPDNLITEWISDIATVADWMVE